MNYIKSKKLVAELRKIQIDVSSDLQRWLETMVEQKRQDRFDSAAAIRAMPIRFQADSLKLMSYPLVKNKLAIANRFRSWFSSRSDFDLSGFKHSIVLIFYITTIDETSKPIIIEVLFANAKENWN